MRVRLPLRLAVGRLLLDGAPRTACDVCTALEPEYAGERQINAAAQGQNGRHPRPAR